MAQQDKKKTQKKLRTKRGQDGAFATKSNTWKSLLRESKKARKKAERLRKRFSDGKGFGYDCEAAVSRLLDYASACERKAHLIFPNLPLPK